MQKSAESRSERKATSNFYYHYYDFPLKASLKVASRSAPAPPRAASPRRWGQCPGTQPARPPLPEDARAGACCGQSRSRPGGRLVPRRLDHPPLASSHCTSAPRLRPAPRSPRPCPAGHRRARKPSFPATWLRCSPRSGPHLPVLAEQEVRGSLVPRLKISGVAGEEAEKNAM